MFIPDPGSRGQKSTGSRIRVRITLTAKKLFFEQNAHEIYSRLPKPTRDLHRVYRYRFLALHDIDFLTF
jgi:hypothetical protein